MGGGALERILERSGAFSVSSISTPLSCTSPLTCVRLRGLHLRARRAFLLVDIT